MHRAAIANGGESSTATDNLGIVPSRDVEAFRRAQTLDHGVLTREQIAAELDRLEYPADARWVREGGDLQALLERLTKARYRGGETPEVARLRTAIADYLGRPA